MSSDNVIQQREKQIKIGKATTNYQLYVKCIPKNLRNPDWKQDWHPVTPRANNKKISKRCFDGIIKSWRRKLHLWGSLREDHVELLLRNPKEDPHKFELDLKKLYVPPVYQQSELIVLNKPAPYVEAAKESARFSKFLSKHLILSDGSYEGTFDDNLPVAFLPIEFRGMQPWPPCLFVREEDVILTIKNNLEQLYLLQKLQNGTPPKILGTPFTAYLKRSHLIISENIADLVETKEILKKYSLADYNRIKIAENYHVLSNYDNTMDSPLNLVSINISSFKKYADHLDHLTEYYFYTMRTRF